MVTNVGKSARVGGMGVPFAAYGAEIYLQGLADQRPALPTDPSRLEAAARSVLDDGPFGYVAGGAGGGATMRANRAAFDRYGFVPRMLRDTTVRDWSTTVLGTAMPAPLLLAPIGVMSIVHPDGELAVARAAAELGVPMVLSTASSHTIEEAAAASGDAPRWYQLYWPTEDEVTVSILERARAAGHRVLVVTLDTWTLGWRPHDLDLSSLPFLRGVGTAIPFSDPAFRAGLAAPPVRLRARAGRPGRGPARGALGARRARPHPRALRFRRPRPAARGEGRGAGRGEARRLHRRVTS